MIFQFQENQQLKQVVVRYMEDFGKYLLLQDIL